MNAFLNDIPLFVEVARRKSYTAAAEALDIGASTLSRRIKTLEAKMGVLLFYRDTRNVELTPNGSILLDRCEFILAEAQEAYGSVVLNMQEPSGLIRICMSADTYTTNLKNLLNGFAAKWPDIRINLTFVEHSVDMRVDPYDVAFLIGPFIAPPLIARKLFTIEPCLYASPELLLRFPKPNSPQELYKMPCIVLERFGTHWTLDNGSKREILEINPHYKFSSIELCRDFTLAGHGVSLLRKEFAAPDEKEGRLVRILPEWNSPGHNLNLVTGPGQLPQRVRLFVDHMLSDALAL